MQPSLSLSIKFIADKFRVISKALKTSEPISESLADKVATFCNIL